MTEPRQDAVFEDSETRQYEVVVNDEEQYSIWPADREPPPGWRCCGMVGLKADCLQYISSEWTDIRPKSLRDLMGT